MLHKIPLFFLFFFLFSSSLLAQDNEKFANMACRFIGAYFLKICISKELRI